MRGRAGATRAFAEVLLQPLPTEEAVRAEARRTLLNFVGCVIGGSRHDTVERVVKGLGNAIGAGDGTLFGRTERTDIFHASLINGIASNVYGFDDTHLETVIHPAGPVAAALFAYADLHQTTGRAFLDALIVGVEAECRVGLAAGPEHYAAGWHITSTAGVFGATAAVGRLAGLGARQLTNAFGVAASQSGGLRRMFGSMTVSYQVGRAAQNGLTAALLAQQGFTASQDGIEGSRGWAEMLSPGGFDTARLTRALEAPFEISRNTYKPFASGIVTHPAMEAAMTLVRRHRFDPASVALIEVEGHPLVEELTGNMRPLTGLQSKVSIAHAVAVAIVEQGGGPQQFSDRAVASPPVMTLRDLVRLRTDPSMAREEARVTITLTDGQRLAEHVAVASGSRDRPMSDPDLAAKFVDLTADNLSPDQRRRTLDACLSVDRLNDVGQIARGAAGDAGPGSPEHWQRR